MSLTRSQVSQLYVTLFGRASEGNGNAYWMTDQPDMTATANVMLNTDAAKTYFGTTLNDNQAFIEHIYTNVFGKTYAQDTTGIDYWVAELAGGKSMGEVVHAIIVAAQDPVNAGAAQNQFNNKVEVSDYTASKIAKYTNLSTFTGFVDSVTDSNATVTTAKSAIDVESITTSGVLSDGRIKEATVFADANGDGVWNSGEKTTTTDFEGKFTLTNAEGSLVATGGTDISTGLGFEGTFTAPADSTMITPITTLVDQVMNSSQSITAEEAVALVAEAMGISTDIDLLTFDPIATAIDATASAGNQAAAIHLQAISVQVSNMIGQAAAMLDGAGTATEEEGAISAAAALADMIVEASTSGTTEVIDLASAATVETFLQATATEADATAEQIAAVEAVVADIATATAGVNDVMAEAVTSAEAGTSAEDIFTELAQTQVAAEDIEDLVESGTETGDATDAVTSSDATTFAEAVDAAADTVGSIAGGRASTILGTKNVLAL